jgi:iron-sulfur cluster assembly protein
MSTCSTVPSEVAAKPQAMPSAWQGSDHALPVTLSEAAAKHIAAFIAKRGKGVGIRLGVRTSGCSGMAYKLEFADSINPEDIEFISHGVKVLTDPKSWPYLSGTELDYTKEGLNEGFKFNNPNVKDACGCGESFNV